MHPLVALLLVLVLVGRCDGGLNGSPISRIVVLMMENHSFDNLLGWLPGVGDLTGKEYNLVDPSDPSSQKIWVGKGASYCTNPDPNHDLNDTGIQIYFPEPAPVSGTGNATMGGFVYNFLAIGGDAQAIMNCYTPQEMPVISALATEYRVCSQWYSSLPGPTGPNRMFVHAATTMGYDGAVYDGSYPITARTIYEQLMGDDLTWEIHYHDFTTAHGIVPLNTYTSHFIEDYQFTTFFEQIANDTLPAYTFLVPLLNPYGQLYPNTQHPMYDIRAGETVIKEVYEALRNSSQWNETLLILTYDEHGGFWDSKPPGPTVNPSPSVPATPTPFAFNRLGVRVPTVLISPWIAPGVDATVYDHTSIPESVRRLWKLNSPPLSARSAVANTFDGVFLSAPRTDCPTTLPDVPSGAYCWPGEEEVHGLQRDMLDMYSQLLEHAGHRDVARSVDDVRNDRQAGEWLRMAQRVLFPRSEPDQ